jgi:hypothetical protein
VTEFENSAAKIRLDFVHHEALQGPDFFDAFAKGSPVGGHHAVEDRTLATMTLVAVITQLDDFAARVRRGLDRLSWPERQHIIRTLVAPVDIDENGATVVYRLPPASSTPSGGEAGLGG